MLDKTRKPLFLHCKETEKIRKCFIGKISHSARKCKSGEPLGFISIHSVAKYQNTLMGQPLDAIKKISKKVPFGEKIRS